MRHRERTEAFEKMLADIKIQTAYETEQMEMLKAAGKERNLSAVFRKRIFYKQMLYKKYRLPE